LHFPLSLHDALPISGLTRVCTEATITSASASLLSALTRPTFRSGATERTLSIACRANSSRWTRTRDLVPWSLTRWAKVTVLWVRSEEHTSELQSREK